MQEDIRFKLLYHLGIFYHQSHQYMKNYIENHKILSAEQLLVLHIIQRRQPLKQKDIAKWMRVKPATISLQLKRMEADGLVSRQDGSQDRRETYVSLTEEGQTVLNDAYQEILALAHEITNSLSDEDILAFQHLIEKILKKVQKKKEDNIHV